jgi:hypothetical protein
MSKKKMVLLIISAAMMLVVYIGVHFGELVFCPFAPEEIPGNSVARIEFNKGNSLESVKLIDRVQANNNIFELYSVKRKGGEESRVVTIYRKSLWFNRYQCWDLQDGLSLNNTHPIKSIGFPYDCTVSIVGDKISIENTYWGVQLWTLLGTTSILVQNIIRAILAIMKYGKSID